MKQTITIRVNLNEKSRGVMIDSVYELNGILIAVAHITQTSQRGEALCASVSSLTVKTDSNRALPVKCYIVNNTGRAIPGNHSFVEVVGHQPIKEIAHLLPLPLAKPSHAEHAGLFLAVRVSNEQKSKVWERELDSFPLGVKPVIQPKPREDVEDEPIWSAPM